MENLSGHGKFFDVPSEIKKWNWGAFWLTWIWGFFNDTFISLLVFIPGANFVIPFYLGYKGNELSWRNKRWKNDEGFFNAQRKWARAGWIMPIVYVLLLTLVILNQTTIKNQEEYIIDEVYRMISENEEAINLVGEDFEVLEYIRGSQFVFWKTTHSIILNSSKGKYWVAVRFNDGGQISEILVSHYYVIEGFHEVIIQN